MIPGMSGRRGEGMKDSEMLLTVYGKDNYQIFELPPVAQEHCKIVIQRELFRLAREIILDLDALDGGWSFRETKNYNIVRDKEMFFLHKLRENDVLTLHTAENENLLLVVSSQCKKITAFQKISLSGESEITIGSTSVNRICYQNNRLVSKNHAKLERINKKDWIFRDTGSTNGSYYNHSLIRDDFRMLSFGDEIHIYGLRLIFLGEILALESFGCGRFSYMLRRVDRERLSWITEVSFISLKKENGPEFYNCPTRKMPLYETEPVEIESPPAPGTTEERSLLLTIGPSLTMVIPMMIGAAITGSGNMSVGLVTMFGSAGLGAFWAYMNYRAQKKKIREHEEKRFREYSEYLKKKEKEISDIYERNLQEMQQQYPDAKECSSYDTVCGRLWNRNEEQSDFMFVRLGKGETELQAQINIPKERFTLIHDTLAGEPARIRDTYQMLKDAPVGVDLNDLKLLGIIGGKNLTEAFAPLRTILVQLAASVNYQDLKIVFICNGADSRQESLLDSVKWLPHDSEQSGNGENMVRFAANDTDSASAVLKNISQVIRERLAGKHDGQGAAPLPRYVLFVLEPELLRDSPAEKELMDNSPYVGVTTVICTERFEDLPNTCSTYIEENKIVYISEKKREEVAYIPDSVEDAELNAFAHRLASIQIRRIGITEQLPELVTFFELYGVQNPEELKSGERWRLSRIYESMRVPFGLKDGRNLCYLDVHDGSEAGSMGDGPHGLVAGTTGSGKSETLQSILLSLALNFSPEDLSFFIIDYKGGGMGNLFTSLPHMQGQISNLSGRDIDRAVVSLRSELRRRQRVFEENGVNKIDTYIRRYKNHEISSPMPHLVLVIDEFAELKKERPEFIKEIVSIATIGRSLGVHLILSTQKPGGVVDDTINSNTNFRLCLKVAALQDSRDMLRNDDAVYITQTGRGYLKVGEGKSYDLFQSAWSGAPAESGGGENGEIARMYTITGETVLVGNHQRLKQRKKEREMWIGHLFEILNRVLTRENHTLHSCVSDASLVETIYREFYKTFWAEGISYPETEANTLKIYNFLRCCYECEQYAPEREKMMAMLLERSVSGAVKFPEKTARTQLDTVVEYLADLGKTYPKQHKLWLPVLAQIIPLPSLQRYQKYAFEGSWHDRPQNSWSLEAVAGMYDDPENQQQNPLILDFSEIGHWAVYGAVASGKSTFLQTVIYGLLTSFSPREVQIYGIDFSSRMMGAFREAPGMGDVIFDNEPEKLRRFFFMLAKMLQQRKKLLAGGSFSQYVRAKGMELPAVVIVLDQYGAFRDKTGDIYQRNILEIIKEGASCGVYLICTANAIGSGEIPSSLADQIRGNISLLMNDRYQYGEVLKVAKPDTFPDERYRGRGLAVIFGRVLEFQTAVALDSGDDYQRMELIREKCRQMEQSWDGEGAPCVPEIPDKPLYSRFVKNPEVQRLIADSRNLPVGYDVNSGEIASLDLGRIFSYLITGRKKTGKTNFLQVAVRMAALKGGKLCVIDTGGTLERLAGEAGAKILKNSDEILEYFLRLKPEIEERSRVARELIMKGTEETEIFEKLQEYENIYIFIADMREFLRILYEPAQEEQIINGFFEMLVKHGRMRHIYLLAEFKAEDRYYCQDKEFFRIFAGEGTGILFGGMAVEQNYLDFSSFGSMSEQNRKEKPGTGWTAYGDGLIPAGKVVVPLVGK